MARRRASHSFLDVLIVAGDVSDNMDTLRTTLTLLCSKFGWVFFCPGNHDLWVGGRHSAAAGVGAGVTREGGVRRGGEGGGRAAGAAEGGARRQMG